MSYHIGSEIVVASNPRGVFMEGTIKAGETPIPGVIVQIDGSAGLDARGRPVFELANMDADGGRPKGPLFVLREDPAINTWGLNTTGYSGTTTEYIYSAYAAGAHCYVYCPVAGEELNLLVKDDTGTAAFAAGQIFIVDDTTGQLVVTAGTPETEPFMLLKAMNQPSGGPALGHFIYTGY